MKKSMWWGLALLAVVGMGVLGGCKKDEDKTEKKDTEQTEKGEEVAYIPVEEPLAASNWLTSKVGIGSKGKMVGMSQDGAATSKALLEVANALMPANIKEKLPLDKVMPIVLDLLGGIEFKFAEDNTFTVEGVLGLKDGETPSGTWRQEKDKVYIKFNSFEIDEEKTGKERHLALLFQGAFKTKEAEETVLSKVKEKAEDEAFTLLYTLSMKKSVSALSAYVEAHPNVKNDENNKAWVQVLTMLASPVTPEDMATLRVMMAEKK